MTIKSRWISPDSRGCSSSTPSGYYGWWANPAFKMMDLGYSTACRHFYNKMENQKPKTKNQKPKNTKNTKREDRERSYYSIQQGGPHSLECLACDCGDEQASTNY